MKKEMTLEEANKMIEKVRNLAYKAVEARQKLDDHLDKLRETKSKKWQEACMLTGYFPESGSSDWMC